MGCPASATIVDCQFLVSSLDIDRIGDGKGLTSLVDQFTGLHDVLLKGKTQGVRHLRLGACRRSCSSELHTSGSNAE